MSSLAEINKELQRQSTDIAEMKKNIAAQLKAEIDARKAEERLAGKREEQRREAVRKAPKGLTEGFKQGSGIAGAQGLLDGFLKGFFGAGTGILAAILGSVGLAAGKLVKGTLVVGLLTAFGEKAIKALFDKLGGTALDLNLTKEQEDKVSKKVTDGFVGWFVTGLIFKNPLIKLGSAIVVAFKDEILGAIYRLFGIEEVSVGPANNGKVLKYKNILGEGTIDIPKMSETLSTSIVAVVTGFLLYITNKVVNMAGFLIRGGKSKAQVKLDKLLKDQETKFNKQLTELEDKLRQQQLLKGIQTSSPTIQKVVPGSMASYTTKAGNIIDVDVLKNMPDGKVQVQGPKGNKFIVGADTLRTYSPPATKKPPLSARMMKFLGMIGAAAGKAGGPAFAYTSQYNIRSGMYGDLDPTVATGIEFLAAGGDIIDLVNYLPDKALEMMGSDFRFGTDAGEKTRSALQSFLSSEFIPPQFRSKQKTTPISTPTILTPEQSAMMVPGGDSPQAPSISIGHIGDNVQSTTTPTRGGGKGDMGRPVDYYFFEKRIYGSTALYANGSPNQWLF